MIEGSIGLGDILRGSNCIQTDFGKVEGIHASTGSRKGMLYHIGNGYYFADEVEHDWWRELMYRIGNGHSYDYKEPIKLTYNRKRCKAIRVEFGSNYYVVCQTADGSTLNVHIYLLQDKTLERLVRQYYKEQVC